MADSPHIVQLDESNFMKVVVEGSDSHPVLVDFWADWCAPCKALMPILEKLAVEYDGAFVLAKLDTEAFPGIAQQLGIRSLPTVKLFRSRQLIDEFMGALPESEIRRFLETHIGEPPPGEDEAGPGNVLVEQAMLLFQQGHAKQARSLLEQARSAEPDNADILLALAQVCLSLGDSDAARGCLEALPEEAKNGTDARRLAGMLELASEAEALPDVARLRAGVAADPKASQLRYQLAIAEALDGDLQSAMEHLLTLVQRDPDYGDGAARKKLLALFDMLGEDPLAGQYRRRLFTLLH